MIAGRYPLFALTAAALLSAACTSSEAAAPEMASEPVADAPAVAEVPAPPAPPPPPSPPPPAEPARAVFAGEMTQGGYITGTLPEGTASAALGEQALTIGEDRAFFAAFDRDSPASLPLTITLESGEVVEQTLTISPRQWDIERVNIARRPGGASAAFMRRRQPELDAIWNARQRETGATGWQQDFIWPVTGRISGRFGRQRIYRGEPGSYHSGIDIAPGNGVPFVAPADGVVVLARTGFSLEGGLIIIDHGAGLNSAFLHASRIVVEEGEEVRQGQHIGNVGSTGRATGPHLHWSLKWRAARLDPLLFTGPMN